MKSYVLITPARNEVDYIEKTLTSVINQTVLPKKWVIVSDGSTDGTDEIVKRFEKAHSFIMLLRSGDNSSRNFGSKVDAFNYGLQNLGNVDYDFIGNLDGDMGFDSYYFEKIIKKFEENPKLGIAGGVRLDYLGGKFINVVSSRNSVAGAFQLFRKECFEKIGGYRALRYGGIDAVAETMTRMHGWQVESFEDIKLYHYKPTGSAHKNVIKSKFRVGIKFYLIGYHPVFVLSRFLSRYKQKPVVIGSLIAITGYIWASLRRYKRPVPKDFVRYLRKEQKHRLREFFTKGNDPARKRNNHLNELA